MAKFKQKSKKQLDAEFKAFKKTRAFRSIKTGGLLGGVGFDMGSKKPKS